MRPGRSAVRGVRLLGPQFRERAAESRLEEALGQAVLEQDRGGAGRGEHAIEQCGDEGGAERQEERRREDGWIHRVDIASAHRYRDLIDPHEDLSVGTGPGPYLLTRRLELSGT